MGRIWILGGMDTGSLDPEGLDARPEDVRKGKVFGGTGSDEPQMGEMPVYGGDYWNRDLSMGLEDNNFFSFAPYGYHAPYDKRGTLHRIPIQRLREKIGATPDKILSGQSIAGVQGSIPVVGSRQIVPGNSQQTAISAGQYASGNIAVAGDSNLRPENIKKGVTLFGIAGTWEGYTPVDTDLYYRGNNVSGWTVVGNSKCALDAGQISCVGGFSITSSVSLIGFTKLNIDCSLVGSTVAGGPTKDFFINLKKGATPMASVKIGANTTTVSVDLSAAQISGAIVLEAAPDMGSSTGDALYIKGAVYRIWLS